MGDWEREQKKAGNVGKGGEVKGRPEFLPPPTEVPLRYCKHNDEETAVEEVDCLIDLLAGQPKGNEQVKNKHHFVLATAEPTDAEKRKAGRVFVDVREAARNVPGVPIVYVKRSVMVLEELSRVSLRMKGEVERERLREGLVGGAGRKRKRGDEEEEGKEEGEGDAASKGRVVKVKGPNPLSVKKKKPKPQRPKEDDTEDPRHDRAKPNEPQDGDDVPKAKRRRKHKSKKGDEPRDSEVGTVNSVAAASLALQEVVS